MPTFQPPFLEQLPRDRRGVGRHLARLPVGVTMLRTAGVWTEHQVPTTAQIDAAEIVLLGGHIYWVDDADAAELEAQGWTVSEHDPFPSDTRFASERDYPGDG